MYRLFVFLLLIFASPAFASQQVISSRSNSTSSAATTQYLAPMCGGTQCTYQTDRTLAEGIAPTNFTIKKLSVELSAAPDNGGGTQSYVYTVWVNGSATAVTFTVSEAGLTGSLEQDVSVTAGQPFAIEEVPSGTPTTHVLKYSMTIDTAIAGESIYVWSAGSTNMNAAQSARTTAPFGQSAWSSSDNNRLVAPTDGTIKKLYVRLGADPDNGVGTDSYAITVAENGSNGAVTTTVADGATTGNDTSNTIDAVAGDTYSISQLSSGSPTATTCAGGLVFLADAPGNFIIPASFTTNTSSNQYGSFSVSTGTGTESSRDSLMATGFTMKAMYVVLSSALDADGTMALTLREETTTSTALTCTVASLGTTANLTQDVTITAGNTYDTLAAPSTTPGAPNAWIGYLGFIADPVVAYEPQAIIIREDD